jgi:hypothetical protein
MPIGSLIGTLHTGIDQVYYTMICRVKGHPARHPWPPTFCSAEVAHDTNIGPEFSALWLAFLDESDPVSM